MGAEERQALLAKKREYARANKEKSAAWWKANPEKAKEFRDRARAKRHTNPQLRLVHRLRERVRHALKKCNGIKCYKTEHLTGCTWQELHNHIGSQLADGMSWDNMGEWHIDHIRPCSSFDLTKEQEQLECFHFSNLQPLWAKDNYTKSDSFASV